MAVQLDWNAVVLTAALMVVTMVLSTAASLAGLWVDLREYMMVELWVGARAAVSAQS